MAKRIIGTWEIVSSADFDDEYLNEQGTPYVSLQKDDDRIVGEYHIGLRTVHWMATRNPTAPSC